MIRRRRPQREIAFSFDSFLDVVANVVGIIIRLILVAWVGARSYTGSKPAPVPAPSPPSVAVPETGVPVDPLREEMERHQLELAQVQARLVEQLRRYQEARGLHLQLTGKLEGLKQQDQVLDKEEAALNNTAQAGEQTTRVVALSLTELHQRRKQLIEDIEALEKMPALKKVLHYRTPVSKPVHSEEYFFECNQGRVTFLDIASLLAEVRQEMEEKSQELRTTWEVEGRTPSVGAFRLHFRIERERGVADNFLAGSSPEKEGSFRYGLTSWEVEPVTSLRGENIEEALNSGSQFRQVVDRLDPQQGVVTFWVFPESFDMYRRLRDFLYERDLVVAGRPLPTGANIASSRKGTVSRGQ